MSLNPKFDGVHHINIYSKGQTELGRLMSNFTYSPFTHPKYGEFVSIEGLWYWLLNPTLEKREKLRTLYGYTAKKVGRDDLKSRDWCDTEDFKNDVILGLEAKLVANERLRELLVASNLPFVHYYVYGEKVIEPTEGKWILEFWEKKRDEYKRDAKDKDNS